MLPAYKDEHHGDTGRMFSIGDVSVKSKNLISATYESMMKAISIIKPGIKLGDIGATIQDYVELKGSLGSKRFLWPWNRNCFSQTAECTTLWKQKFRNSFKKWNDFHY